MLDDKGVIGGSDRRSARVRRWGYIVGGTSLEGTVAATADDRRVVGGYNAGANIRTTSLEARTWESLEAEGRYWYCVSQYSIGPRVTRTAE
jgi:hypothetical protein